MPNRTVPGDRLAMLGSHLRGHGFDARETKDGLVVRNPERFGCCGPMPDTITCAPRGDGDDRLWFWSSWGEPLAEHGQITQAVTAIKGNLSGRSTTSHCHGTPERTVDASGDVQEGTP